MLRILFDFQCSLIHKWMRGGIVSNGEWSFARKFLQSKDEKYSTTINGKREAG